MVSIAHLHCQTTMSVRDRYFACCNDASAVPPKCAKITDGGNEVFQYGDHYVVFRMKFDAKKNKSFAQDFTEITGNFLDRIPATTSVTPATTSVTPAAQYEECCADLASEPPKCKKITEGKSTIFQYGGEEPYYLKFSMQHLPTFSIAHSFVRYEGEFHLASYITLYAHCKYHVTSGYCTMQYKNGVTTFTYPDRKEVFKFTAPVNGEIISHTVIRQAPTAPPAPETQSNQTPIKTL